MTNPVLLSTLPVTVMVILNDIEGLENPSSENVCQWIWERLAPSLPGLSQIDIKETDSTGCIYKGE